MSKGHPKPLLKQKEAAQKEQAQEVSQYPTKSTGLLSDLELILLPVRNATLKKYLNL